jgi:hypothetical protein
MNLENERIFEIGGGLYSDWIYDNTLYNVEDKHAIFALEIDTGNPPTISAAKWLIAGVETAVSDAQKSQWFGREVTSGIIRFRYPVTEITLSGGVGMVYVTSNNDNV